MKTSQLYGIIDCSKTRVRCVFCGVCIPKASKCIEQHTNGTKHKENIDLMSENGISFNDDVLHCRLCKRNLSDEESVTIHIESDEHATWLAAVDNLTDGEFISLESYLSCEKDDVYCDVCSTSLNCSLQTIEEHVNNINHRINIAERLKPLNGIFPVDNDEELWCKVCDAYIENSVQSVLSHIDDDENHTEWFEEIEDLIEDQGVSIEAYLANEHEGNAYCDKCHADVPCSAVEIEAHVNGDAHLNQFAL